MKIFIAQQNYHIGNFEENCNKIINAIQEAKERGGDLIIFSEMCVCGYPARDFLEFNDFIELCYNSINRIREHSQDIGVIIGSPSRNTNAHGKKLFNSAFLLYDNKILAEVHKTLLPTYDIFDEYRYFEPAFEWKTVDFKNRKIAITVCEDIWNLGDNPLYRLHPMDNLIKEDPDFIVNLSASPFDYSHHNERKKIIKANIEKYKVPLIYCNSVGSQTEIVFDGGSLVYDKHGTQVCELPLFREGIEHVVLNGNGEFEKYENKMVEDFDNEIYSTEFLPAYNIEQIYNALVMGIKDYFSKMGFSKAIIGSSGGIDSAVTQALASEALGNENVYAVLMPSQFSSEHSVADAVELSKKLGNPFRLISINEIYDVFNLKLEPAFHDLPFSVAEENMQSRIRGNILMTIANKFGYILINTSNKSELATGYGTLYGDMAGGLSVLGDCYKLQVYELAKYINRSKEIIPHNIISKAPSAELRPNQKDSDSLPDYNSLDQILFQYIENRLGPNEIKQLGYDSNLVDKTLRLVNINEYKRNQFCPIIRVSLKAFGVGRRVPIVGKYLI